MKTKNISYAIAIGLISLSTGLFSQPSPPPELPDHHGMNGDVVQNAAPLGDGTDVLLLIGAIYVLTRVLAVRKRITPGI